MALSFKNRSGAFPKMSTTKNLCTPAFLYFAVSIFGLLLIVLSNLGNYNIFSLGGFRALVPDMVLLFVLKLIYILFWTWVLNLICRDGHSGIAWVLVLLPFIILFLIAWMAMSVPYYEGMTSKDDKKEALAMKAPK